jgi:ketosteroid isomerase-like protein
MERPISRLAVVLVACLGALLAIGCGGNGDEQSAPDAAQAYVQARKQGDAAKVCDLYSDQLKQQIAAGANCEAFVEEQTSGVEPGDFRVVTVQENGDRATAAIESSGEAGKPVRLTVVLERQDGDWKITSLGTGGEAATAGD